MIDPINRNTKAQFVTSKINAGFNNLPDWAINAPVGTTKLGTPYFDSVKMKLSETNTTDEYINTLISVSKNSNVIATKINGRKGFVKQIVDEGDYDIVMNIKIFAEYDLIDTSVHDNLTTRQVGRGFNPNVNISPTGIEIQDPIGLVADGFNTFRNRPKYLGDYTPNGELGLLIDFLTQFENDKTYTNIQIESLYLNDVFGIYNIVPYSISTQQNAENSNMYNIIISAYSDLPDETDEYSREIIPK